MAPIRRIIYRSKSPMSAKGGRAGHQRDEALGEQFASLLGVRGVFEVEENEFFRDKFAQVSTFGLAGKRGISEGWNLAETQLGSVFKSRILMVTMSSVLLFSIKKGSAHKGSKAERDVTEGADGGEGGSVSPSSPRSPADAQSVIVSSASGQLINRADELKTSISMEDINFASQFIDPKNPNAHIFQIRSTQVTGAVRNTLVRCATADDLNAMMDVLEVAIKSYRSAIKFLRNGLINERSQAGHSLFTISSVSRLRPDGGEQVESLSPRWGDELAFEAVSRDAPLVLTLAGPSNVIYRAKLVPYQVKLAAEKDPSGELACIRADPVLPMRRGSVSGGEGEDGAEDAEEVRAKPLSIYLRATILPAKDTLAVDDDSAAGPEKTLALHVRETRAVALVVVLVLATLVLPEWCFDRRRAILLLTAAVAALMMAVRSAQGHRAILESATKAKQTAARAARQAAIAEARLVSFKVSFENAVEGLAVGVMPASETLESYRERYSIGRRLSALAAAGAVGGSVRQLVTAPEVKEGVDGLIAALSGAHDDTLTDDDCPQKWFDATDGNAKDAVRQWKESLQWRREQEVDTILSKPQSNFFRIKTRFPHAWLGNDSAGHLVTLEQFGSVKKNVAELKAAGIGPEDFASHCVFMNEYWIKNRLTKTGRLNKIIDLKGFGVSQLSKEVIGYFQPMNHAMQQYPELIIKVHIINAPSSFRFAWRIVSAFLARKTTEKISVVSGNDKVVSDLLTSMMPKDILLPAYGGTYEGPLRDIPVEVSTANYVRRLNHMCGAPSPEDWDPLGPNDTRLASGSGGGEASLPVAVSVGADEANGGTATAAGGEKDDLPEGIEQLVGRWVANSAESESMEPVLELQGVPWLKRKASRAMLPAQSIQITGDESKQLEISTMMGPITSTAIGVINGPPSQQQSRGSSEPEGSVQVSTLLRPPAGLEDRVTGPVIELRFKLSNGDNRVVHHAIERSSVDKKVMRVQYERAKDGATAAVVIVSDRTKA